MSVCEIRSYPLHVGEGFNGKVLIVMPRPLKILSADCEFGTPKVWAIVEVGGKSEPVIFRMLDEGDEIELVEVGGLQFIDTFTQGGLHVWHIFLERVGE